MVIIDFADFQKCLPYPFYYTVYIAICCGKQSIIPIEVFGCHATIKMIAALYVAVETIHCVQVIKTFLNFCYLGTVFYFTVSNRGKGMITPEPIAKDQRCVSNVIGKYSPQFLSIRFCPVNSGSIGISITLDTCTDADIFSGNASFFSFCPMFAGLSGDIIT